VTEPVEPMVEAVLSAMVDTLIDTVDAGLRAAVGSGTNESKRKRLDAKASVDSPRISTRTLRSGR
jgi:hypothetical protein